MTNSVEQMKEEKDLFRCFVAETGEGEIIGMALCLHGLFHRVGKSLYLEDIYVKNPTGSTG
ncbi:MAG: hypothetical protein MZU97_24705 [Bacillus subtilis]|nr:hypothetical protein [Bacillus subtilis]